MPDKSNFRMERFVFAYSLKVYSQPQLGRQGGRSKWQLITHFICSRETEGDELCVLNLKSLLFSPEAQARGRVLLIFIQIFLLC